MESYGLIQPRTLQSWIANSIIENLVQEFDPRQDPELLYLYWTDKAKTYDGIDWDNPNEQIGFWLHIVYQLCDRYYDTGLWRDVRNLIVKPMREILGVP